MVEGFDSGDACMTFCTAHPAPCMPDLALLDYSLPGNNGVALAWQLHDMKPELPLVLMSGLSGQSLGDDGALGLFARVLTKPFTLSALHDVLDDLVSSSR